MNEDFGHGTAEFPRLYRSGVPAVMYVIGGSPCLRRPARIATDSPADLPVWDECNAFFALCQENDFTEDDKKLF